MTSSATSAVDFGPLARRYDELRDGDGRWDDVIDVLVSRGGLEGVRVLDVGCGTGRLAARLAERHGCLVAGVDASPEMLAVARGRVPPDVRLEHARAEQLPFAAASFDRVAMTLVFHHLDRPRALAETRRVLAPAGKLHS